MVSTQSTGNHVSHQTMTIDKYGVLYEVLLSRYRFQHHQMVCSSWYIKQSRRPKKIDNNI
jgi:hypothetical protein